MIGFEEIRCPNETCYGWISEVEESPNKLFYGCGSCGNVWQSEIDLYSAVSSILKRYAYRASVYIRTADGFEAVDLDDEPEDYEELVVKEWSNVQSTT